MGLIKLDKKDLKGLAVYIVTVVLMIIPIVLTLISPTAKTTETVQTGHLWWKGTKTIITEGRSPFSITPLAAVYAVILFTILLIRNRKTIITFGDEKTVNVKAMILYILDLFFLTTVCSLIPSNETILFFNINCKIFMIVAILISLLGMKSLSGYIWIVVTICLVFNLSAFDRWGMYGVTYVLFSYMSIVSQVLILNIFEFDINELLYDFGKYGNIVTSEMKQSVEVTKEAAAKAIDAVKTAATGIPQINEKKGKKEETK